MAILSKTLLLRLRLSIALILARRSVMVLRLTPLMRSSAFWICTRLLMTGILNREVNTGGDP